MNIMIVDDEPNAVEAIERAVRSAYMPTGQADRLKLPDSLADIACFTAADEALLHAAHHRVDVAFLDMEMPYMNGLELAQALQARQPGANIIFVTVHGQYAIDAFKLRASGYVLKPIDPKRVAAELAALRKPVEGSIRVQCFGSFQVYAGGQPLVFGRPLSREILAYIVDRRGAWATKKELAAILWGDEPYTHALQSRLYKLIACMVETLRAAGAGGMVIKGYGCYAVDTRVFSCDYYDYLDGKAGNFVGEYMAEYSWGEYMLGMM